MSAAKGKRDDEQGRAPGLRDTVRALESFWSEHGCLLLPGCDFGVPAASYHPDAFFYLLGGDPWQAAFLQPVRRPLDARYGRHPFRLGRHLQFQVLLKPPADSVQELFLASLEALGFDLAAHDLRFSDWRFEARSLDARGSGWRLELDGLGVTRITFLERLAGQACELPVVEISYGVERLAMVLQGAGSAYGLAWAVAGPDYGALRRGDEEEFSRWVFEVADGEDLERRIESLEREAERCLAADLVRRTYELAVRSLESLDVLEARGELSARDRRARLERVRDLVCAAAVRHLELGAAGDRPVSAGTAAPAGAEDESPAEVQAASAPAEETASAAAEEPVAERSPATAKRPVPAAKKPAPSKRRSRRPRKRPAKGADPGGGKGG